MGARNAVSGLGYAAGDIIGTNVDPGWSGPAMRIVSLGSGEPVHWNTGGSANISLPAETVLQPIPANGWIYRLGTNGFLTSSRDPGIPDELPLAPVQHVPWPPAAPPLIRPRQTGLPPDAEPPPFPGYTTPGQTTEDGGSAGDGASGVPTWAWIVGGGALLYFLSGR